MDYEILDPKYDMQRNYVVMNEISLKQKYNGSYIAVLPKGVIDHDKSKEQLLSRMEGRTFRGYEEPLIGTIAEILGEKYNG